ncbi:TPA: hypothetical protein PWU90_002347 [Mannheimia haemolytica]|uniref:hypothetical protein n=1 Tax=Mannheimia haemolytica TaxID=75985 RepID=UPI00077E9856|nr:hypothetical protein [Mannheimia haemolytica]KYL11782.1 hypothetical protein AC568_01675 [Mannheimia haemolytica]UFK43869.1 hypothetical protein LO774_06680 [Mannheimia haemolytica]UQX77936.1 hypothetical protein M3710_03210 [Mannheimia haemolytica]UQX78848.1 hypothetical protein M3703_08190 [Mannheimia haemolytica]HDL1113566.1 hypothetical protein [Mannheimia haemolytica]
MKKSGADTLALLFARDIAKTSSASTGLPFSYLNKDSADSIADFVETLSKRFEALDDMVHLPTIINAYKSQSDR